MITECYAQNHSTKWPFSLFVFQQPVKALLIALSLFACRPWLEPLYQQTVLWFALRFLDIGALTLYVDSLDKIIPFAALMFATPGVPWSRRLTVLAIGVFIFLVADILALKFSAPTDIRQTGVYNTAPDDDYFWIWEAYGRWLLPLLLWLAASCRFPGELFSSASVTPDNPARQESSR